MRSQLTRWLFETAGSALKQFNAVSKQFCEAGYSICNDFSAGPPAQQPLATTYKTLISLFGTSGNLTRGYLYEFNIGADGAPANNNLTWNVSRMTADAASGNRTAVTPNPLNKAYNAMQATGCINYNVEPTLVESLWTIPLNQQSTYRWVSGREALVYPAVANNGLVIRTKSSAYTQTALATAFAEE